MTILNWLEKLENLATHQSASPDSAKRLIETLENTYQRIVQVEITSEWLRRQSNATAFAVALHGPRPPRKCVFDRLQSIASGNGAPSKLAQQILEAIA
jgi:hypothetical protein